MASVSEDVSSCQLNSRPKHQWWRPWDGWVRGTREAGLGLTQRSCRAGWGCHLVGDLRGEGVCWSSASSCYTACN